jgi:SpoVK/Ycf46/Vps4 family AAA+-type ATPase
MKGKNKKTNLDLPVALKIKIQLCEFIDLDIRNSLIFKLYIKNFLFNKALSIGKLFEFILFHKNKSFTILESNVNNDNFMITEDTNIDIVNQNSLEEQFKNLKIEDSKNNIDTEMLKKLLENNIINSNEIFNEASLNGCEEYISQVDKIFKLSVLNSEKSGLPDFLGYKGIILNGPIGIGKSYLVKQIISKYSKNINFLNFDITELLKNEKEEYVRNLFKYAKLLNPAVIVLDDIDKLFYSSDDEKKGQPTLYALEESKTKLMLAFLNEFDSIGDKVIVLATSTSYERLESDFKKNGRFDYVINISPPKQTQRKQFLQYFAKSFSHELTDEDYEVLADKSHGFVAGDIVQIFKNLQIKLENGDKLTKSLLENVLKDIKPISLKDIILDIPKVLWSDIGGNKEVIKKIRQSIEWPLKHPESFKKIGISPPNVIIYNSRVFCYMVHQVAVRL